MPYQEAGKPGIERFGLAVDPNENHLVVEDTVGDRRTQLHRFDRGPSLTAQLFDANGDPRDLSGSTVTLRMRRRFPRTDKIAAGPVTIVDALLGRVRYDWAAADTDETGVFDSWMKVDTAGVVETFPNNGSHEVVVQQ